MSTSAAEAESVLDTRRYTELLSGLLECYSPSTQERAASEYLVEQMKSLGYDDAYVDESNSAVGIMGDGPNTIVLLGHIDTVHGFIPVEIKDGKLYGRGSVDAKGPLATFAAATAFAGRQEGWRIVVIGAVEEEYTTSKGARHATTQFTPNLCIIGEPSQWDRITLGYKGRILLDYTLKRALSHTAGRDRNAPELAVAYWNAINNYFAEYNEDREKTFDQVLCTLRSIQTSDDGFHEIVNMTLGFRLPLDMPPEALKPLAISLNASPELSQITFRGDEIAYRADRNTTLTRLFNNAIRDHGAKPGYVYKTGTSDMNTVGMIWTCPMVAYGPGDSNLDHTPEEHIQLEEYFKAIQVLSTVLRNLNN
ncbi:MAG: [LysW]-lysine hydrolase [Anaerolineae bacterium]|nr:[LysW]-lysine hydrolase [Anaerolineae bacterium]